MKNAKDYHEHRAHKFLVLGKTGSGKTSGFLTLPGKKFLYCFDSNAILTIQGQDVDYEEYLPDDLSLKLTSLSKETMKKIPAKSRPAKDSGASLYRKWEEDFEDKLRDGFFDSYDVIGIDSFTTLSDLVMDGVLALNGRPGTWPNLDDYGPQMLTLTNICRTLVSLGKTVYFTGHIETRQDETTKRIMNQPVMTGRLKSKLPLLFSEILITEAQTDMKGNVSFNIQTRPDRYNDSVRCTLKNASFKEDVTIDWNKPVVGQGIGGLYR